MLSLKYPTWAVFVGIAMTSVSVLLIPVVGILRFFGMTKYTKDYPSPIRNNDTQTLLVNDKSKVEMNGNKQYDRNGAGQRPEKDETFV